MPPTYRKVAPAKRNGRFLKFPPPPSHQPARQFDHTVGRFETLPRIKNVRSLFITLHVSRFTNHVSRFTFHASYNPRSASRSNVHSYSATNCSTTSRFFNS